MSSLVNVDFTTCNVQLTSAMSSLHHYTALQIGAHTVQYSNLRPATATQRGSGACRVGSQRQSA